jgi:hypothetical protein
MDKIRLELTASQVSVLRELVDDSIYEVEHFGRLLNGAAIRASDQGRVVEELREMYESLSNALRIARDDPLRERDKRYRPPY